MASKSAKQRKFAKGGLNAMKLSEPKQNEHTFSSTQDLPIGHGTGWEDLKRGVKNWGPEALAMVTGDSVDVANNVLQRIQGKRGPNIVPGEAGAAVRRRFSSHKAPGTEVIAQEPPEKSTIETIADFTNPAFWLGPGKFVKMAEKYPQAASVLGILAGVPGELGLHGGMPSTMGALGVMKNKGGNWVGKDYEKGITSLAKHPAHRDDAIAVGGAWTRDADTPEGQSLIARNAASNEWVQGPLTKYLKNEMATPEDPVRLAAEAFPEKQKAVLTQLQQQIEHAVAKRNAEQARRGFTPEMMTHANADIRNLEKRLALEQARTGLHFDPREHGIPSSLEYRRKAAGQDPKGLATTDLGRRWENMSDNAIITGELEGIKPPEKSMTEAYGPWAEGKEKEIGHVWNNAARPEDLGFMHITDELRNALNPESGLPQELLLNAKDLKKITVPQMVEHVDKINAWRSVQKAEANAQLAMNPAAHTIREYPEGYKWVELKQPEFKAPEGYEYDADKGHWINTWDENTQPIKANTSELRQQLADQLKYEGAMLQHCVGGYCDDVTSGKSRIFSLRNNKGEPFVTIETTPDKSMRSLHDDINEHAGSDKEYLDYLRSTLKDKGIEFQDADNAPDFYSRNKAILENPTPFRPVQNIAQIKGKKNLKPADEYLPFVHDFIRQHPEGTQWGDIQDFGNTNLRKVYPGYLDDASQAIINERYGQYATPDEIEKVRAEVRQSFANSSNGN